jgi:uncharacterized protein YegP (UPF0339 family)
MKHPRFEVYTDKAGKMRFRLTAKNGQPIVASQGYASKASCMNGIESVKKNSADENLFTKNISEGGKFSFSLKSTNGQIIATSQSYASESGRDNGIKSVMENAPIASIFEEE